MLTWLAFQVEFLRCRLALWHAERSPILTRRMADARLHTAEEAVELFYLKLINEEHLLDKAHDYDMLVEDRMRVKGKGSEWARALLGSYDHLMDPDDEPESTIASFFKREDRIEKFRHNGGLRP